MANNILDMSENAEELQAKASKVAGDPLDAIIKDVFRADKERVVSSPEYQASRDSTLQRIHNGTLQNVVTASSLQVQPSNAPVDPGMFSHDIPRPVDKADERMEAALKNSIKSYGANGVALVRVNTPEHLAQAIATADRIRTDCIIGTKDGLVLHGHSPVMQEVRSAFSGVIDSNNTLPAGPNTNVSALATGVCGQYRISSWMEMAHTYGITEKPGVSYTVCDPLSVHDTANMARAMHESGVHNPAVVSLNKDGTGYIMLDSHNFVAQEMCRRHAPAGTADGFAQFKFDSKADMAKFLTEMSDYEHDVMHEHGDAEISENDGLDEVGDIE